MQCAGFSSPIIVAGEGFIFMSRIYVLPVALGHLINSLSEAIAATAHDPISSRVVVLFQEWCYG